MNFDCVKSDWENEKSEITHFYPFDSFDINQTREYPFGSREARQGSRLKAGI